MSFFQIFWRLERGRCWAYIRARDRKQGPNKKTSVGRFWKLGSEGWAVGLGWNGRLFSRVLSFYFYAWTETRTTMCFSS